MCSASTPSAAPVLGRVTESEVVGLRGSEAIGTGSLGLLVRVGLVRGDEAGEEALGGCLGC